MANEKAYEKVTDDVEMVNICGLGEALKKARNAMKMSRIDAGVYCGVSETTIMRWEKGATKSVSVANYNKIVDILNGECCA